MNADQVSKHTVLILADSRPGAIAVAQVLSGEHHTVILAWDVPQAVELVRNFSVDALVVDLGSSLKRADDCLGWLQHFDHDLPKVLISERSSPQFRVAAIGHGADRFIQKPYAADELRALVTASLRRRAIYQERKIIFGPLEINLEQHTVLRDGIDLRLTKLEFLIAKLLLRNNAQVITRDMIVRELYGDSNERACRNLVDVHMCRVRQKLTSPPISVRTIRHVGYRMVLAGVGQACTGKEAA